ncbi:MAG TPA: ARMT1-like domain-containing protein [Fibrobacteria bacterium]|nr:ARMT1-like domain-containing protein [Fibrobacteria bacterium]HOX50135.1 ARMT1-like domain-containing protein [Fibrobacteria bacterium]
MVDVVTTDETILEMPLECRSCILGQAMRTAREAGLPESEQSEIVQQTAKWMSYPYPRSRSTLHLGRLIADQVVARAKLQRDFDIYHEPKALSNRLAQTHTERLRRSILESDDPLAMAIRVAAAGNVIDFGAKDHSHMDIESELRAVTSQPFERFDIEPFRQRLASAASLLYICDNAGEIVFDGLLMEAMRRLRPELEIHAAFRDAPILNDATVQDALAVGIDGWAEVFSSGSRLAGSKLDECSVDFRLKFSSSDLVVSKGQGNLSSLIDDADERVFFVFRTKCPPTARRSGTTLGNLQMIQGRHFPPLPSPSSP